MMVTSAICGYEEKEQQRDDDHRNEMAMLPSALAPFSRVYSEDDVTRKFDSFFFFVVLVAFCNTSMYLSLVATLACL
jgi:hypothetical protein